MWHGAHPKVPACLGVFHCASLLYLLATGNLFGQSAVKVEQTGQAVRQYLDRIEGDSRNAEIFYDLGQACLQHALAVADRVMAESKTSPYSRRIFAENFIGQGSLGEAETQYRLARDAEPNALDVRLSLAGLYMRENQFEEARREIARALNTVPTSLAANFELAELNFLRQDLRAALASLDRVANLNPVFLGSNPSFLEFISADSLWKEECPAVSRLGGHQSEAAVLFLQQACRTALAHVEATNLLPQNTGDAGAPPRKFALADRSSDQTCFAGLCAVCEEALRPALAKPDAALEARLRLGQCAYVVQNYAKAYRQFAAARELNPPSLAALYWEGEAARQLAQWAFRQVERLAPDSYLIHVLNAQTLERQNQPELAAQEYKAAIARQGNIANLYILLAHLYWNRERYDDALPELQKALELDPADPAANYMMGDMLVQEHQPRKALPYLDEALRVKPRFLNAEASLGRALSQLGRNQEAVTELRKVASDDADGSIHFQLFQLYRKLGQDDKAQEALESFKRIRAKRLPQPASGEMPGVPN